VSDPPTFDLSESKLILNILALRDWTVLDFQGKEAQFLFQD